MNSVVNFAQYKFRHNYLFEHYRNWNVVYIDLEILYQDDAPHYYTIRVLSDSNYKLEHVSKRIVVPSISMFSPTTDFLICSAFSGGLSSWASTRARPP